MSDHKDSDFDLHYLKKVEIIFTVVLQINCYVQFPYNVYKVS